MNNKCLCEKCENFDNTQNERYCKVLQINWLPKQFGCNKFKSRGMIEESIKK